MSTLFGAMAHKHLAALVIVITTLIWSLSSTSNHAEMSAKCMGNKGSTADVVTTCTMLMGFEGLTPAQHSRLLSARGCAYYNGKSYDEAIVDFNAASELQPGNATPILRRALALDAMGVFRRQKLTLPACCTSIRTVLMRCMARPV